MNMGFPELVFMVILFSVVVFTLAVFVYMVMNKRLKLWHKVAWTVALVIFNLFAAAYYLYIHAGRKKSPAAA